MAFNNIEYQKQYYIKNKDKLKDKLLTKIKCNLCNCYVCYTILRRHQRSRKCQKLQQINNDNIDNNIDVIN